MLGKSNPEYLPLVSSDEFLPSVSRWTSLGGLFLIGTCGAALAIANHTQYNVTVRADATVRPSGEIRLVQATTEGTIKSIPVKENSPVKQGDAIASVDDSSLQTKKSQLQGNIQQNKLQINQINAQINSIATQIAAETRATERAIAAATAELSRNQRDFQQRQITTQTSVQQAEANLKIAEAEVQKAEQEYWQATANLETIKANLKAAEANLKAAQTKRDRYKPLAASGAISLQQLQEAELAIQQQEQAVLAQKAAVEAQKKAVLAQAQTIERQKQTVAAAFAKLEAEKAALNPSTAPITISRDRIAQEKAKGDATLATLTKEQQALIGRRLQLQNQILTDTREIEQIEKDLQKTTLRSPVDGTILQLNLRNSGQTVRLGDSIAQIAPNNAAIVVKARIKAQDIGKIKLGQTAQLQISAYPYPDYGTLPAKVSAIAPDAIANPHNNSPYYEVTLQPEKNYLTRSNIQYPIQPGMAVTADIISREETVLTFILRQARLLADV
jgi:multidrug efflux pump subunit AcrA (membrane-fusion protein)